METDLDLKVDIKMEPNSDNEASQDNCNAVDGDMSTNCKVENVNIKLEIMNEEPSSAPESITVKLEPTCYSSGDGPAVTPSTSQTFASSESSRPMQNRPKTFEDLLDLWEKNEEFEEFGFFFAYCRTTADCGGYYVDTDTSIDSDDNIKDESMEVDGDGSTENDSKYYLGRNGYRWSKTPVPMHGKTKNDQAPSCTLPDEKNPYKIWNHLIDDSILQEILKWTNVKLAEYRRLIGNQSIPHLADLDLIELKAFLGAFLYSVYINLHIQPVSEMFPDNGDFPIFQCIMTEYRFTSILNSLSFGDPQLENETSDKNISVLFEKFVCNCQKMYKGSGFAVFGETVVPFWRGDQDDCFPMKYAERPCKDGFRLHCLFDVKNGFLHNMYIPYTDLEKRNFTKDDEELSEPTKLALLLTRPLHSTNTNITCNKEYMSFELIDAFTKNGLTCVGTIEQSNKEIPREFKPSKKRVKGSTLYGYSENVTLVSYMNKRKKATIIASSMLSETDDNQSTQKPELLKFYNRTRYARMYDDVRDCHRRTTLVSMALFYKLIDFSIHNTYILYSLNFKRRIDWYEMFKSLAKILVKEHLMRRALDSNLPEHVRGSIIKCLGSEE